MTTEKQLEANRRNAQQSTGPKTEQGKAIAKLNAVKHGILSDVVLITKGDGQERRDVYQRLYHGLRESFQPQGMMEEALVEQIVVYLWRKRRVLRYELGCIRQQLDAYQDVAEAPDEDVMLRSRKPKTIAQRLAEAQERLERCQQGVQALQDGCDILSEEGADEWEENYSAVAEHRGMPGSLDATAAETRDWLLQQGFTEAHIRQELLQVDAEGAQEAQAEIAALEPQATLELERAARLASLPADSRQLDKIIRYEAALDRQLYKAIHQLERLQRSRAGEQLPPPLLVEEA